MDRYCRICWMTLAILMLIIAPARALDPDRALTQYVHRSFTVEQGLPQDNVKAIAQDGDGFLWIGTQEGVARFDGIQFIVLDRRITRGFTENLITSLCTDENGDLLVGTFGGGVLRHREGSWHTFQGSLKVKALAKDRDGYLWIGTFDQALIVVPDHDGLPGEEHVQRLLSDSITALVEDRIREGVWVGSTGGLHFVSKSGIQIYQSKHGLPSSTILSLQLDHEDTLWIGTARGLASLRSGTFQTHSLNGNLGLLVSALLEDRERNLWIGTQSGLARLADGNLTLFPEEHPLSHASVEALFEDGEGSLWIGTTSHGLHQLRNGTFITLSSAEGLPHDYIISLTQSRDGTMYFGTRGHGLIRKDARGIQAFTTAEGLPHGVVKALCEDAKGRMWVGTPRGLAFLKGDRAIPLSFENQPHGVISVIMQSREKPLWVGTFEGLFQQAGEGFAPVAINPDRESTIVLALFEDSLGRMWVGTDGHGVACRENGVFREFTKANGPVDDVIWGITEDKTHPGTLWFSSYAGGLIRFRDGEFQAIGSRKGMFDDLIIAALEDERGYFWCSCNRGIFRVNKQEVEAVFDGRKDTVLCRVFGTEDGMKGRECSGGNSHAARRTHDGSLWFATTRGATRVVPRILPTAPAPPHVFIENVIVDGMSRDPSRPIVLEPDAEYLELHYAAPSFRHPSQVRFRFRLQGVNRHWIDAGSRRVAYFNRIPAGEFRFQVTASHDQGAWDETGATIQIERKPHFYHTWPFVTVTLFLLCLLLYGGLEWRTYRVKHQREQLESLVAERTRELQQTCEKLATTQEQLLTAAHHAGMAEVAIGVVHNIGNVLNSVVIATQSMNTRLRDLHMENLKKTVRLLDEHKQDLPRFLTEDAKGKKVLPYLAHLSDHMLRENHRVLQDLDAVNHHVERIRTTIEVHQSYAEHPRLVRSVDVIRVLRDLLYLKEDEIQKHHVRVRTQMPDQLTIKGDQPRVFQALSIVLENALDAMNHDEIHFRELKIEVFPDGTNRSVRVLISDNGVGMKPEQLARIFHDGYTTKTGRNGSGLHACANAMTELRGKIRGHSHGKGLGATFELTFEAAPSSRDT